MLNSNSAIETETKKPGTIGTAQSNSKPRLLIVSSYQRPCGIAQYVEHLEEPLKTLGLCEVDISPVPVDVLKSAGHYAKKLSKRAVFEIVEKVKEADVVNLQLEPGLYGSDQIKIWRNISAILNHAKKVIITYHTVPPAEKNAKLFFTSPRALKDLIKSRYRNYFFSKLFKMILSNPNRFAHIVQTQREAKKFELFGIPSRSIHHMPLSFLSDNMKRRYRNSTIRRTIEKQYGIKGKRVIGSFGFLSPYKGVETAIRALDLLPEDFHLLIVGGLHPEGIVENSTDQPYISKLLNLITTNIESHNTRETSKRIEQIANRVSFCGTPANEEFNCLMQACDSIILPYAEVGQTSSGPAAVALDLEKPIYCSRNHAFRELGKYAQGGISYFEIGNHFELSQILLREDGAQEHRVKARSNYARKYNIESRSRLYAEICKGLVEN
ncbi:hypothetical protein [Hoeflea prorocentri]|uniref:Glycosyl transferase family 1 domain-containing protein n=1 Tax=Hoeflea prorocentri TaxID=1922333 RepID=A0A9X3UG02_9HYPH|nr:hypothetical protein [Hoeflea prorocentri]MCY6379850.1 hypothetical protein [Hoeflea prorocentri]MDA5397650.1 hypothetical protein [Hoeflea prorocentri]